MSSRSSFRRKVVLPVTIIRRQGQERQLAHTLDLTSTSARIGGLISLLDPGEIIEVHRGANKANFQVVWMGAPGGAMSGQAGIRSLTPDKTIWNVNLPQDETDANVDVSNLRQTVPAVHSSTKFPGEKRWQPRYACSGRAAVRTTGSMFAVDGEVKDISKGGVYVELKSPLPENTKVNLDLCVEDIPFAAAGVVRTNYPFLGMGIGFQSLTPENAEKLALVVERAKRRSSQERAAAALAPQHSSSPATDHTARVKSPLPDFRSEENPGPAVVKACRKLAEDFDQWKNTCTTAEIEEVKLAIRQLQVKLFPKPVGEFVEYLGGPTQSTGVAQEPDQSNPNV